MVFFTGYGQNNAAAVTGTYLPKRLSDHVLQSCFALFDSSSGILTMAIPNQLSAATSSSLQEPSPLSALLPVGEGLVMHICVRGDSTLLTGHHGWHRALSGRLVAWHGGLSYRPDSSSSAFLLVLVSGIATWIGVFEVQR